MTNKQTRILIIGAGYAGMLAAVRLAAKTRRVKRTITLVNAADVFVERMRLHQVAANQTIAARPIAEILRGTDLEFVQGVVTRLAPALHEVTVEHAGAVRRLSYDYLMVALGSTIDRDSIPGVRENAYVLTPDGARSAFALRELLPSINAQKGTVVVVGGGATGIEAAAEFAETYPGIHLRLVTQGEAGAFLNEKIGHFIQESLTRLGVTIQPNTTVTQIKPRELVTASGAYIPFDACLWAGGFRAQPLARESGLTVNDYGQILVDPFMRSISHPDIYALGDAAYPIEEPGVRVRMSAFTAAVLGAHAADCLSAVLRGSTPKPLSFAYAGQGIALGRHDAIGFNNYPNDKPNMPYFTGKLGVEIREFFVRFLADAAGIERRMPGFFLWMGKGRYTAAKRRAQRQTPARQGL
ncbi:MAG: FAD-dependent oxidoreductase [Anaerolineae bacterium]